MARGKNNKKGKVRRNKNQRKLVIPQYRNLAPQSVVIRDTFQCQLKLVPTGTVSGMSHYPHVCFFDAADGYNIYNPVNSGRESWQVLSQTTANELQCLQSTNSPYRRAYSHYYVLGSKMTATLIPTANYNPHIEGNVQLACGLSRDNAWPSAGSGSGTSLREFTQARNTTTRQIMASPGVAAGAPQALSRCRMFSSYSPKKILGINDTTDNDDLKVSVVDGKVGEASHFFLALQGLNTGISTDPTGIAPYIINVKIDYILKFTEPVQNVNEPINKI